MSSPGKVQAVLLAAGLGRRLGQRSETLPKCMQAIDGSPILEHVVRRCVGFGLTELIINTHHLPHVVMSYFGDGREFGARITYSHERNLLGTAGTVRSVRELLGATTVVWYA